MKLAWNPNSAPARHLLAATVLAAVAASFAQPATAMPPGGMGEHAGMHMAGVGGPGMMGARQGERALDAIGASAEQKTQLRHIMDTARADMKPLREAGRTLHGQLRGLFAQPTVDARAVETVRQQLQANHELVSKRMMQAMLDASRVLNPEQRKQMAERMEQRRGMMQRHRAERETLEGGAPGAPGSAGAARRQ